MRISFGSDVPIYEQVVNEIRRLIQTGQLRPGDSLPPVRQLASQLDVAPNTIARAYQELANLELTEGNRRRGSIVREDISLAGGQDIRLFKEPVLKLIQQGRSRSEIESAFRAAVLQIFD